MSSHRRILFVCFVDSVHAQSWMNLLAGSEFETRVFASLVNFGKYRPSISWSNPTYILQQPRQPAASARVYWLLPRARLLQPWNASISRRLNLPVNWLRWVIRRWKPDIVHSLSLSEMGSAFAWQAMKTIPKARRPRWVVSSWGSDIYLGMEDPVIRPRIEQILSECDGFFADCRRDIALAEELGLAPEKATIREGIPGSGGLDLNAVGPGGLRPSERRLILVPKGYEGGANTALPVLEALRLLGDRLTPFEAHFLMSSPDLQRLLSKMPALVKDHCVCHETIPQPQVLELLRQSRVMAATSLSDGTPNVMLEAMATGALPLMSPLESIQEWITDGENGLLAPALHPEQIAAELRRGLSDDGLCEKAARKNRRIVEERANRALIRPQILEYYRKLTVEG